MNEDLTKEVALPWQIEDIDLSKIEIARVRDNETLFFLLTSASFVESGADLYTRNLIDQFSNEAEISGWLSNHWEAEEIHHGRALRTYIAKVWPEFDWQKAFDAFFHEYASYCNSDELESTHVQELAARCVVETGTSSLYRSIHEGTDEPVLKMISDRIRRDEVNHYKYFLRYFSLLRSQQNVSRWRIFRTVFRRLIEARNDDAACALRHVYENSRNLFQDSPGVKSKQKQATINRAVSNLVRGNWPIESSVKMLLRPLQLSPTTERLVRRPLQGMMRIFMSLPI